VSKVEFLYLIDNKNMCSFNEWQNLAEQRVTASVRKDFRPSMGRKSGLHRHGYCLRRPRFALVASFRPSKGIGTSTPNGLTAFRDALQVFSENPPGATPIGD
jgi:hypothetical protein